MTGLVVALGLVGALWAGRAYGAPSCNFITRGDTWILSSNCVTDRTILIPDGFTLDGNGHRITAVDPPGGSFVGAVVRNGGASASVRNLRIEARDLAVVCHIGDERLRGILFDGASGSIADNEILAVNQGASGCQEGQGIEVRNTDFASAATEVAIRNNKVGGYQKTGILAHGNVAVIILRNVVTGSGPVDHIARNGIQVGFGATGKIVRNEVSGNSYTGPGYVASGIIVPGGEYYGAGRPLSKGVTISLNELRENDVGVLLSQLDADGTAPDEPTRVTVLGNEISKTGVTNGAVYQAGISDAGHADRIIANRIRGAGYDPETLPGHTWWIDARPPRSLDPKIVGNRLGDRSAR